MIALKYFLVELIVSPIVVEMPNVSTTNTVFKKKKVKKQ